MGNAWGMRRLNQMNEFDKNDLLMIYSLALQHVNQFRENSDCIELMGKTRTLIDAYCEHEKVVPNYDCKKQCEKCGKIL